MVYIMLPPSAWTISGLSTVCQPSQVINIDNNKYLSYKNFKQAASKLQGQIHSLIKRQNVISNLQMKKIVKQAQKTPQQKKIFQQIRVRHQTRLSNKRNQSKNSSYYFQQKTDESVKDLSKSISFGMTFIFSFFMAGLTGYYFGTYFLSFDMVKSLMLAVGFIIFTIVVETSLYIIKQNKQDKNRLKQRRKMRVGGIQKPSPIRLDPQQIKRQQKKKKNQ